MKQKLLILIGIVLVFLVTIGYFHWRSKSSLSSEQRDYSTAIITLERTACFGTCPIYSLTISGDGKVVYTGENYVTVTSTQTGQISPVTFKELVDEFYKINYFSLQDEYTANITDMPTTITSLTINGKTKKIEDYFNAPEELKKLEQKIDEVANSKQWVGK